MADFRHSTTAPAANSNGHFSTSRRALFRKGAGCVTAIAASTIAMPRAVLASSTAGRDAWTAAKARFVQSQREDDHYYNRHVRPAANALEHYDIPGNPNRSGDKDFQRVWEKYLSPENHSDQLFDLKHEAMRAMVACPAPDLAAVKFKLERVIADEAWETNYGEEMLAAIMGDLDRLGGA